MLLLPYSFWSQYAVAHPVMPAPTMSTSAVVGSTVDAGGARSGGKCCSHHELVASAVMAEEATGSSMPERFTANV
jgi:hypothetical protein